MYKCSFFSIRNDVPRFYKVLFQKIAPRIFFDHLLQANWSEYLYIQTDYQTVNRVNGRVKYFDKIYIKVIFLIIVFAIHLQDTLVLRKLSLILNKQIIKISVHVIMCTSFINIHKYANLYKRICIGMIVEENEFC